MSLGRRRTVWLGTIAALVALVLVPRAVDAQDDGFIVVVGERISTFDDVVSILAVDPSAVEVGDPNQTAESPFGSEFTPMPGPIRMWVSAAFFSGIDVQQLEPPTLGADDPAYFYYTPIDFSYYGNDQAFVGYQVIVDGGEGWRDTYPYLEAGVGLSKPGLDGATSPEEVENDPFVGSERTNSFVWGGEVERAVTGFARQEPGLDLFQSAYITAVTPLTSGVFAVTTLIPDPTYDFRHVVSWGDGVDPNSVGFIKVDGAALGTQDPIPGDLGAEEAARITAHFAEFVSALGVGAASPDETPPAEESPPPSQGQGESVGGAETPIQDETSEGTPLVLIVGGFVLLVLVIGGVTFFVWGNRKAGTEVRPTAGNDRTGGELFDFGDRKVSLEEAHQMAEETFSGMPQGAPLLSIPSLLTRAEAVELPKTSTGWQLLEFDMAHDYLERNGELEWTWDRFAPEAPKDGNVVGIWYHEEYGFRLGSPADPFGYVPSTDEEPNRGEQVQASEPGDEAGRSDTIDMDGDGSEVTPA